MQPLQSLNRGLQPWARLLVAVVGQYYPGVYVASTKRSRADQTKLYDAWVAGRSRYPAAAPGTSKHEQGLAFDLGGLTPSQLADAGATWRSWGGRWGGDFSNPDPIHFEV